MIHGPDCGENMTYCSTLISVFFRSNKIQLFARSCDLSTLMIMIHLSCPFHVFCVHFHPRNETYHAVELSCEDEMDGDPHFISFHFAHWLVGHVRSFPIINTINHRERVCVCVFVWESQSQKNFLRCETGTIDHKTCSGSTSYLVTERMVESAWSVCVCNSCSMSSGLIGPMKNSEKRWKERSNST
jgi:hypothetical protein